MVPAHAERSRQTDPPPSPVETVTSQGTSVSTQTVASDASA